MAAFISMIFIDTIAAISNVVVISVILACAHLRENITYVFVLGLAFTDLLCSLTVLPLSIVSYSNGPPQNETCLAEGYLSTFFMACSIFCICAISVERFYSIKWPMHYSAHMSMKIALFAMGLLCLVALLLAGFPLMGWSEFQYHPGKSHCSYFLSATGDYGRSKDNSNARTETSYAVTVGVLCFVVPGIVVLAMYRGIYRVAQQTACQIQPAPSTFHQPSAAVPNADAEMAPNVDESEGVDSGLASTPASSKTDNVDIDLFDGEDDEDVQSNLPATDRSHWKAIRTLLIIILTFFVLWAPYFVLLFYEAAGHSVDLLHPVHIVTTWLAYTSHAVNPLVYGLLNRNIREALLMLTWYRCHPPSDDLVLAFGGGVNSMMGGVNGSAMGGANGPQGGPGDEIASNEDFFQFLERTSSIPNDTSHLQTLDVKNLPCIVELHSQNGVSTSTLKL